ncbi:unnamed protein product [Boreogadus saida]
MDFNFMICVVGQDKVIAGESWDRTAAQGSDTNSRGHPETWRFFPALHGRRAVFSISSSAIKSCFPAFPVGLCFGRFTVSRRVVAEVFEYQTLSSVFEPQSLQSTSMRPPGLRCLSL